MDCQEGPGKGQERDGRPRGTKLTSEAPLANSTLAGPSGPSPGLPLDPPWQFIKPPYIAACLHTPFEVDRSERIQGSPSQPLVLLTRAKLRRRCLVF